MLVLFGLRDCSVRDVFGPLALYGGGGSGLSSDESV